MVTLHMQVCVCVHRLERMLSGTNKHRARTCMCVRMCMCVYSTCTYEVCTVRTCVHSGCTCVHGGDGSSCSESVCVCVCVCVYTWLHERACAGCMHCTSFCVHKCARVYECRCECVQCVSTQ